MNLRSANPPTLTKALILEQDVQATDLLMQMHAERVRELAKTQPVYVPGGDKCGSVLYLPLTQTAQKFMMPFFSTC